MRPLPTFAALAPLALLAACGGGDKDDSRTASGQVLEGTISDSMLPLDTVRSQPPLAKETGAAAATASGAPDAEASETPEDTETPEPEADAPSDANG